MIVYPDLDWNFSSPYGITEEDGFVYVADSGNHRIRKLDKDGRLILEFGKFGEGSGEFNFPYDVATDKNGDIYVADTWNNRIQKFTKEGSFILSWGRLGETAGNFKFPHSLTVNEEGVWVVDTGNRRVQKFTKDGEFIMEFGGMKWPTGIDIEAETIWISDAEKNMVMKFSGDGKLLDQISGFDNPHSLAVKGDIYVANTGGNNLLRIKDGKVSPFLSGIKSPYGVAAGHSIYVAETGANKILLFNKDGKMDMCWETKGTKFGRFSNPKSIVCGKGGDVYVADTGNNRVYRLDSSLTPKDTWNISAPCGLTLNDEGSLYVVSNLLHKVEKFDRFGNHILDWENEMISPKGIAYSAFSKNLYVCDTERDCLTIWTSDGRFLGTLGTGLSDPEAVVCDRHGNIYVADIGDQSIKVFSSSGGLKREIKEGISYPLGLAMDQEGNLYVSQENGDVCKMNQSGAILKRFSGMKYPQGIYINEGYLYVADTGNNRLKKIPLEEKAVGEKKSIFQKLAYKELERLQNELKKEETIPLIELKDVIKITEKPTEEELPFIVKIEEGTNNRDSHHLMGKVSGIRYQVSGKKEEGIEEIEEEVKVVTLPDLVIEELNFSGPEADKWAKVSAKIKNQGKTFAEDITVEFFANGEPLWFDRTIHSLNSGEDKTKNIIWKPPYSGTYTLSVIVDPANKIAESNRENNRRDIEVFVK
jgi:DNA-binding beta-propeller fold protein YncE